MIGTGSRMAALLKVSGGPPTGRRSTRKVGFAAACSVSLRAGSTRSSSTRIRADQIAPTIEVVADADPRHRRRQGRAIAQSTDAARPSCVSSSDARRAERRADKPYRTFSDDVEFVVTGRRRCRARGTACAPCWKFLPAASPLMGRGPGHAEPVEFIAEVRASRCLRATALKRHWRPVQQQLFPVVQVGTAAQSSRLHSHARLARDLPLSPRMSRDRRLAAALVRQRMTPAKRREIDENLYKIGGLLSAHRPGVATPDSGGGAAAFEVEAGSGVQQVEFRIWRSTRIPGLEVIHTNSHEHSYPPHLHDTLEIIWIREGEGRLICHQQPFEIHVGEAGLVSPNEIHSGGGFGARIEYVASIYRGNCCSRAVADSRCCVTVRHGADQGRVARQGLRLLPILVALCWTRSIDLTSRRRSSISCSTSRRPTPTC